MPMNSVILYTLENKKVLKLYFILFPANCFTPLSFQSFPIKNNILFLKRKIKIPNFMESDSETLCMIHISYLMYDK